jgi:hypothetical protein
LKFYAESIEDNPTKRALEKTRFSKLDIVKFTFITDVVHSTKCSLAKDSIKMFFTVKTLELVNNVYRLEHKQHADYVDLLFSSTVKARKIILKDFDVIRTIVLEKSVLTTTLETKNEQIKKLKSDIRKLKIAMSNMKENVETVAESDNEKSESDDDETYEINNNVTQVSQTLERYESIKRYMIDENVSVSEIANRNNFDVKKLRNFFINLKLQRISIAHPQATNIADDTEFIKILGNIEDI